jgi:DNA polymerase I-like protein with 3'-5' exonuclease and polymerase domains
MRPDAFGFFWQDTATTKTGRIANARPLPEIPKNGWRCKDFPRLEKASLIGLDTETKDLDLKEKGPGVRRDGKIVGISVATEDTAWYFPMRHEIGEGNLPVENVIAWAQDELTRENQPKVGTNLLYDLDYLAQEDVNVTGPFYDIQTAEALINENLFGYSLDAIAQRHLGVTKTKSELEEWILQAYGNSNYREEIYRAPACLVGPYAEADAMLPLQILAKQKRILRAEDLDNVWGIETAQVPLLLAMRRRGVRVDLKKAKHIEGQLVKNLAEGSAKINSMAGFNFRDDKKSLVKLFDKLGLAYPLTDKGNPSFARDFLEHHNHPICKLLVEQRKWEKFLGTFIRGYVLGMNINGRIHCLFNQLKNDDYGTIARYSSSLPNLQNIPARDDYWGPVIRAIWGPEEGETWHKFDWSQIEYRLLVERAKHPSAELARERYRKDPKTDFHMYVSGITGVPRGPAKNINFGLVYGMGEPTLAANLGVNIDKAREMFSIYHDNLPFVSQARKDAMFNAAQNGYITTLAGRRRRFDLWEPRYNDGAPITPLPLAAATAKWGPRLKRAGVHKSLNGEIQGSAADLIKIAMRDLWNDSQIISVTGCPLLTVHDELDFSIPETKEGREAAAAIKNTMESCVELSIPIIAEHSKGKDWGHVK